MSVVPIIIIDTISNYDILKSSENEISNNSIGKLKVAENILDQLESTAFNDSVRFSVNSTINELSSFNNKTVLTNGNNLMLAMHVMNTLTELVRVNDKYSSAYLYLDDFPYVFTSDKAPL